MLIRVAGASGDGERALVSGSGAGFGLLAVSTGTICTALLVKLICGSAGSDSGSGELSPILGATATLGGGGSKGFVLGKSCSGCRTGG